MIEDNKVFWAIFIVGFCFGICLGTIYGLAIPLMSGHTDTQWKASAEHWFTQYQYTQGCSTNLWEFMGMEEPKEDGVYYGKPDRYKCFIRLTDEALMENVKRG